VLHIDLANDLYAMMDESIPIFFGTLMALPLSRTLRDG
jgi:hypothetical protein